MRSFSKSRSSSSRFTSTIGNFSYTTTNSFVPCSDPHSTHQLPYPTPHTAITPTQPRPPRQDPLPAPQRQEPASHNPTPPHQTPESLSPNHPQKGRSHRPQSPRFVGVRPRRWVVGRGIRKGSGTIRFPTPFFCVAGPCGDKGLLPQRRRRFTASQQKAEYAKQG